MQIDEWMTTILTDDEKKLIRKFHYKENGYTYVIGASYEVMKTHFTVMNEWLNENHTRACGYMGLWGWNGKIGWWIFKSEEDALLFKLVWGER